MRSITRRAILLGAAAMALGVLMCANPTDQAPVKWRTAVQVPLMNGSLILGDQLQRWIDDPPKANESDSGHIRVVNSDSTYYPGSQRLQRDSVTGNIIGFAIPNRDTTQFEYVQEKMQDKRFDVVIGAFPLSSAPNIDTSTVIPVPGVLGPVTITKSLAPKITYLRFAPSSPAANVTVTNNTAGNLTNVSINVQGVGSATIASIAANASAVAQIPVAGQSIGSSVNIIMGLTAAAAGSADVSFSFNGLLGDSARVLDSLVAFTAKYTNAYDITDTADISYIDFQDGFLNYTMENRTGVTLSVGMDHQDLWGTAFCITHNLRTLAELAAYPKSGDCPTDHFGDSCQNYWGNKAVTGTRSVGPGADSLLGFSHMAQLRMFPQWDSASHQSVTYVHYTVSLVPHNAQVTVSARDAVIFWIRTSYMQGREMWGHLKEQYERESDTQQVTVDYPFDSAQIEQLRNKFFFDSMMVDVAAKIMLPGQAYMDSLDLLFEIYDPANPTHRTSSHQLFGRVVNDTVLTVTLNVTNMVNGWPSVLKTRAHAIIPKGTEVFVINDSAFSGMVDTNSLGRMTIRGALQYRVTPYFDYHVTMPSTILLGDPKSFDVKNTAAARKLEDRYAELQMHVENHTNVLIKIRGLLAPDTNGSGDRIHRDSLLGTLSVDSLLAIATTYDSLHMPHGYINLLDTTGLYIPARMQTFDNTITLSDAQINAFANSHKASSAWLLTFLPKTRDALIDTDHVDIRSSILVKGIAGTDSLFTKDWK